VIAFALAIAVLPWVVWDEEQQHVTPITTELRSDIDSDVVILAVTDAEIAAAESTSCPIVRGKFHLSLLGSAPPAFDGVPLLTIPQKGQEMLETMSAAWASIGGVDLVAYARRKILPGFSATYSDLVKRVAVMALTRIQEEAVLAHATVVGFDLQSFPHRQRGGRAPDRVR